MQCRLYFTKEDNCSGGILKYEGENADNKGKLDEESTWDEALETAAIVGGFIWAAAKIIFEIIQAVMYGRRQVLP